MYLRLLGSLAVLLGVLTGAATALGQETRPEQPQDMLLGLIVDGREALVVDGYWDGRDFLIPLDAFLEICRCRAEEAPSGDLRITTPLGTAHLPASSLSERAGVRMIPERLLDARLAVRLVYDPSRFALVVDLPWRETAPGTGVRRVLEPDVRAPSAALSSSLFRLQHLREGETGISTASMTLAGRAAGGQWRMRYDDGFGGDLSRLADYGWMRRFDDKLLLLGHQQVNLHPLLGSLEMTGAQAAWTNQPLDLFVTGPEPSELLPRQLRSTATIRGVGVPAGTAVLRIEDRAVAAQVTALDGRYEFRDVMLPNTGTQRIEVLIFDRHDPTVPVEIQDHSRSAGRNLLPGGAVVLQGGFGRQGNVADTSFTSPGAAGFSQARVGVGDRLTLEGAVQQAAGTRRLMFGATGQIGRDLVGSFAAATASGESAFLADVSGSLAGFRINARSQVRGAGFDIAGAPARAAHFFEVSRRAASGTLEVGLIAQSSRGYGADTGSVLPWVYWRPGARVFLRARPDSDGRYRLDATWIAGAPWRLGVSRSGSHTLADLSWRLSPRFRTSLVGERLDSGAHRQAVLATWTGEGAFTPSISAGPLLVNGRPGALLSVQASPTPGILVGARYENAPLLGRADGLRDQRLSLIVTGNLAFAGTRILPGSFASLNATTGSLGGHLRVADGYEVSADDLAGVVIRLDGRPVSRTTRGGRFRIAQLPPGVYLLDFDPAGLPLELTPRRGGLAVEVEPGAVTRADLWLDVEFGLAGRVTAGGENAAGLDVELIDSRGAVVATDVTDRFGFYRLDGVAPGTYRVRLAAPALRDLPTAGGRLVRLDDDYLFDQDLVLRSLPEGFRLPVTDPPPAPTGVNSAPELRREAVVPTALTPGPAAPSAASTPAPAGATVVRASAPAPELIAPVIATRAPILLPPKHGGAPGLNMTGRLEMQATEIVRAAAPPVELAAGAAPRRAARLTTRAARLTSGRPVPPDPRIVRLLEQLAGMRPFR